MKECSGLENTICCVASVKYMGLRLSIKEKLKVQEFVNYVLFS